MGIIVDRLFEQSRMSLAELVSKTGLGEERVEAIIAGRWLASPTERKVSGDVFQVPMDEIDWDTR